MIKKVLRLCSVLATMAMVSMPCDVYAYTIQDAINGAKRNNATIKSARESVKGAEAQRMGAYASFFPKVSATNTNSLTSLADDSLKQASVRSTGANRHHQRSRGLHVEQNFFAGGGSVFAVNQATYNLRGTKAAFVSQKQEVVLAAMKAYEALLTNRELYDVYEKNQEAFNKHLKEAEERFNLGEATVTDVAEARSKFAEATSNKAQVSGNIMGAEADFEYVVGEKAPQDIEQIDVHGVYIPASLEELTEVVLKQNLGISQKASTIEAARSAKRSAYSALSPTVTGAIDVRRTDVKPSESNATTYTLQLSIPLLAQGGAEYAQIKKAKHAENQAKFDLEGERGKAIAGAIKAWSDYHTSQAMISASAEAVKATESALKGAVEEAKVGTRTIFEVLTAETNALNAKVGYRKAVQANTLAVFQMHQMMGTINNIFSKSLSKI